MWPCFRNPLQKNKALHQTCFGVLDTFINCDLYWQFFQVKRKKKQLSHLLMFSPFGYICSAWSGLKRQKSQDGRRSMVFISRLSKTPLRRANDWVFTQQSCVLDRGVSTLLDWRNNLAECQHSRGCGLEAWGRFKYCLRPRSDFTDEAQVCRWVGGSRRPEPRPQHRRKKKTYGKQEMGNVWHHINLFFMWCNANVCGHFCISSPPRQFCGNERVKNSLL